MYEIETVRDFFNVALKEYGLMNDVAIKVFRDYINNTTIEIDDPFPLKQFISLYTDIEWEIQQFKAWFEEKLSRGGEFGKQTPRKSWETGEWNSLVFLNFPLRLFKECKQSYIYIFGGRYFATKDIMRIGVEYDNRYRFHTPQLSPDEIVKRVWDVKRKEELVEIYDAKQRRKFVQRQYFILQEAVDTSPKQYAIFVGESYASTSTGFHRIFKDKIQDGSYKLIAQTQNTCRSKRYGSKTALLVSTEPVQYPDFVETYSYWLV